MSELKDIREVANKNSRIYNERIKLWHDARVRVKKFKERDLVLLFNLRLILFPR